jgi:hypothetical protein
LDGISCTVKIVLETSTSFGIYGSYPLYDSGQLEPLVYVLLSWLVISLIAEAMMQSHPFCYFAKINK